jgi:hypothetical protein
MDTIIPDKLMPRIKLVHLINLSLVHISSELNKIKRHAADVAVNLSRSSVAESRILNPYILPSRIQTQIFLSYRSLKT